MDMLLENNTLMLTANSRLARTLQKTVDQYYQSIGQSVWETPSILPLSSWLIQQFHHHNQDGKILLTDLQERCLWEKIIIDSCLTPTLLHPDELAKLTKEAHTILQLWQIPLTSLEPFQAQLEVKCFIEWIDRFQKMNQEKNSITAAALPSYLKMQDQQKPLCLPNKIILTGFDTHNPATENLFNQLKNRVQIEKFEPTLSESCAQQIMLDDTETELITMAKWLKIQWEKNPAAKLGCVIPELSSMRTQVERVMTTVFCIDNILPTKTTQYPPFNISAGKSLAEQGMIHTALKILTFCHQPLPIEAIASLLQSPYLCRDDIAVCQGAKIDALLRKENRLSVSLSDLLRYEKTPVSRWRALLFCAKEKENAKDTPSAWANHFLALLKTVHWPGSHTQSSEAFQALEKFKKLLHSFSQLDFIFDAITYAHALQLFNTIAHDTIFQPKSHDEPIQIMGTLEASGILFDAVWVLGLHDGIWPQAAKPHPLIPYAIQQQYQTPHATAARELLFCEQLTNRLANCAKHVIFSSPRKNGDQLLFSSRLITPFPVITENIIAHNEIENSIPVAKKEILLDEKANAIREFSAIVGGSGIIKLQALCPFRAFASVRLKAQALNKPVLGIHPITKGILVHHILFSIWGILKTQEVLSQLSDAALHQLIETTIDKTFSDKPYQMLISENSAFFDIEKKRLQALIYDWMQIEKARPAFRVHALETSQPITINQLPLTIRLDRIDELSDGSFLLMDYKTGKNNINAILKDALTEPQLPIYAIFHEENKKFDAVAFAGVNSADMGFNGIACENKMVEKNKTYYIESIDQKKNELKIENWQALLSHWKKTIVKLADDFCDGDARVAPHEPGVCEQCEMKTLCRKV